MTQPVLWVGRPPMKMRALQFYCADHARTSAARDVLSGLLYDPAFRAAGGFFQCDSDEYLMVEFWGSAACAQAMCRAASETLGYPLREFDGPLHAQAHLLEPA